MRVLLLGDFVSPAIDKIESLDHLIGRLITAVHKISLNNGTVTLIAENVYFFGVKSQMTLMLSNKSKTLCF